MALKIKEDCGAKEEGGAKKEGRAKEGWGLGKARRYNSGVTPYVTQNLCIAL